MAETEWAVVANVRPEAFGRTRSPGTRHFSAGTLVWCLDVDRGSGGDRLRVFGRHRGGSRRVAIMTAWRYLVNFRVKHVHAPGVVRAIRMHRAVRDEATCRDWAQAWASRAAPIDDIAARAALLGDALRLLGDGEGRLLAERAMALIARADTSRSTTPELEVLGDWLEDRGAGMPLDELATLADASTTARSVKSVDCVHFHATGAGGAVSIGRLGCTSLPSWPSRSSLRPSPSLVRPSRKTRSIPT